MAKEIKFDCRKCCHFKNCTRLCAAAEAIADLEVNKRDISYIDRQKVARGIKFQSFSTQKKIYELFFNDRMEVKEIADILYVSKSYIYKEIDRIRKIAGVKR